MRVAEYIKHPNPLYRGNLLVEGMGYPLAKKEVQKRTGVPFDGAIDLSGIPQDHHGYYLRSSIHNLFSIHITQDEMVEVYETIRLAIEVGYLGRDPKSFTQQRILTAIEQDSELSLRSFHLKRLDMLEGSFTYLISGLSGRGKSSMVKQALSLIDQSIEHQYVGKGLDGEVFSFFHTQVTYIYLEHHERAGQKAFLVEVLRAIDDAVFDPENDDKSQQYSYKHRNSDVKNLILAVRKALVRHHVGLLIIDEAQNFSRSSKDSKIHTNERISMRYVEELINSLGISTIFVGTFSALDLFSKEMTTTRRTIKAGSLNLASCSLKSSFWIRLCDALFDSVKLPGERDSNELLRRKLYDLTAGIPAIAVSVVQATLRFLSYFECGTKGLTISAMEHVYKCQFATLSGPIAAIMNQEYSKYEDTKPMALLEMVNPDTNSVSIEEKMVLEKQAEDMVKGFQQIQNKKLEGKVRKRKRTVTSDTHEVKLDGVSDRLSPDTLMKEVAGK